jgi:GT2 family glycosyltransferase
MEPTPGWLEAHVRAHGDDPQLCVLGSVPIVERNGSTPLIRWMRHKFDEHMAKLGEPGHVFSLADFYSGNMSIRRESLESVGAYDDAFSTLYGNEDLELYARLRAEGIRLRFSSDACASQIYEKTFPRWARETREAGITAVMLSRKHPELSAELVMFRGGRGVWRRLNTVLLEVSKRTDGLLRLLNATEPAVTRVLPAGRASHFFWYASNHLFWVGVNEAQADGVRTLRR